MKHVIFAAAASFIALSGAAFAGVGADVSVGTPGVSGNVHMQFTPLITLRAGVNYFDFEMEDQEFDDISYDAELGFTQVGGYVDLHPFMNGFNISAGALFGERSIDLTATPMMDIEIGDQTFTAQEVGVLRGAADFGDMSYYAGIGWDSTTHGLSPISFVVRAGVLMTDSPNVSLINEGGTIDPLIQAEINAELANETAQLQTDLEDFEFFPMISIGIGIGF